MMRHMVPILIGLLLAGCMSRPAVVELPPGHPAREDTEAAPIARPTVLDADGEPGPTGPAPPQEAGRDEPSHQEHQHAH